MEFAPLVECNLYIVDHAMYLACVLLYDIIESVIELRQKGGGSRYYLY